jgi:hypothetical protein
MSTCVDAEHQANDAAAVRDGPPLHCLERLERRL